MIEVTFAGAFIAGLLSFLSPCVLPLVPAYLSYISGVSVTELRRQDESETVRRHALAQSLWFIAGFSLVFIALGASASLIGQWMLMHMAVLGKAAGAIIIIFGLHYAGIIRIKLLMMDAHFDTGGINARHGTGAMILGAAFAFGWTPCIGPILGAILAVAGAQAEMTHGILLLATYSLGLAIPFMLAALATDSFLRWTQMFKSHFSLIEKISGLLLIIVGLLIFLGSFSVISAWLIEWFPALADLESKLTP
ncbi:cytochrome c biogenesis protein CcdA [Mariprofundus erugo]|uniref:Cytochrome c biogenesis protein CcdA n=1 Tax=Mariprofundus erugo TaxID=2528639 RepID=A0A5R9GX74_9PROT|nr:cytochrome c biogenesis protein CcdA [Mariprofundus erugo]TLS68512.1 cytochrome c biogenesis protein CcdA [Mariprofundus erugo]TLS76871.1 cytochrome c biogenesis protein CcdA [Mariprofundus erugo]